MKKRIKNGSALLGENDKKEALTAMAIELESERHDWGPFYLVGPFTQNIQITLPTLVDKIRIIGVQVR